ncbi:MAG TPA: potassium channel protein [Gammaproteobacteria bacterium]|nr:potassium channel protein [Gammaproteobacteria bacterium]
MAFSNRIVELSYRLAESGRYHRIKQHVFDLLENPSSRFRVLFDSSMVVLVLTSIAVLIYGVKNDLGPVADVFERFAITIFIIEYLSRFWVYNDNHKIIIDHYERAEFFNKPFQLRPALASILRKKWDYATQPMAVIDLLAILPDYRSIRLLRIFLLFRLFKLMRYTRSVNEFTSVLTEKRIELLTLGTFLAFVVFASATAIYIFEVDAEGSHIKTMFDGIYWAFVTLSTVGYGDITPVTTQGRVVAMVLIVTGIGVISFLTSIIVSAFSEKLPQVTAQRIYGELERRSHHTILCGFGRVGQSVAHHLYQSRERFLVIDINDDNIRKAKQLGYLALSGNAEENELLTRLNIQNAERILCLTGSDVSNVYITLSARQLSPDIEIIARANSRENEIKLQRAGADHTVAPYETAGQVAAQFVGQPVAFEALYGLLTDLDKVGTKVIRVSADSYLIGQPLGILAFEKSKLLLFGIVREAGRPPASGPRSYRLRERRFYFKPDASFVLEPDDLLLVFGYDDSVAHFRETYSLRGPSRFSRLKPGGEKK